MKISELLERYNLKSRKSFYSRLNGLGITLEKDVRGHGYATPEQVELLDQLDEHLKAGGTIASFTPISTAEVVPVSSSQHTPQHTPVNTTVNTLAEPPIDNRTLSVLEAIASQIQPSSPLWYMDELKRAADEGWLLTTAEVRQLISVKPKTSKGEKVYKRGCWLFQKAGKIGSQTAWRVSKSVNEADN